MSNNRNSINESGEIRAAVVDALNRFLQSWGHDVSVVNDDTNLIKDTGAESDEGVYFAIELSDLLGEEVPLNFNPFLHPSGRRGMKVGELVTWATEFMSNRRE